jgi:hypothetical protein
MSTMTLKPITSAEDDVHRDQDIHKGVIEDGRPSKATNAPALDKEGMPNDKKAIAESAIAARADGTAG